MTDEKFREYLLMFGSGLFTIGVGWPLQDLIGFWWGALAAMAALLGILFMMTATAERAVHKYADTLQEMLELGDVEEADESR